MIRKTTVAALVLSAIPAALAFTLFTGTAQADDTPWPQRVTVPGLPLTDIPWDDKHDTPWG